MQRIDRHPGSLQRSCGTSLCTRSSESTPTTLTHGTGSGHAILQALSVAACSRSLAFWRVVLDAQPWSVVSHPPAPIGDTFPREPCDVANCPVWLAPPPPRSSWGLAPGPRRDRAAQMVLAMGRALGKRHVGSVRRRVWAPRGRHVGRTGQSKLGVLSEFRAHTSCRPIDRTPQAGGRTSPPCRGTQFPQRSRAASPAHLRGGSGLTPASSAPALSFSRQAGTKLRMGRSCFCNCGRHAAAGNSRQTTVGKKVTPNCWSMHRLCSNTQAWSVVQKPPAFFPCSACCLSTTPRQPCMYSQASSPRAASRQGRSGVPGPV